MVTNSTNNNSFFSDVYTLIRDSVSVSAYLIGLPCVFIPFLLSLSFLVIDLYLPSNLWIIFLCFVDTITYFYISKVILLKKKSKVELPHDFFMVLKILLFNFFIGLLLILSIILLCAVISLFLTPFLKIFFAVQLIIQIMYTFSFILGFLVCISSGAIFWFIMGEYIIGKEWKVFSVLKGYLFNILEVLKTYSRLFLLQLALFLVMYLVLFTFYDSTNAMKVLAFIQHIFIIPFGVIAMFLYKRLRNFLR